MSASLIAQARLERAQRWDALATSNSLPQAMQRWTPEAEPESQNAYATEASRAYNLRSRKDAGLAPPRPSSPDRIKQMLPRAPFTFPEETGGIIPGYKGHIRGAKDVMAQSLFGEIAPLIRPDYGPSVMQRDQSVYRNKPHTKDGVIPKRLDGRAVVPGSTYFVPGASEALGYSTFH